MRASQFLFRQRAPGCCQQCANHRHHGLPSHRRGAAAVELAVVAPIFFILIFGILEFGRLVMVQQIVTNAAREGARAAVLDGSTNEDVEEAVSSYLLASSVPTGTVTVSPDPLSSAESGDPVSVTIDVPFSGVSWLPTPKFLGGKSIECTVVMRRESTSAPPEDDD